MNEHFPNDICSFLTKEGVDFVTVACEDQNGDFNLHHYEREGANDGLPSNYVSELTREGVILDPDTFHREWEVAKNTITERRFVRVYRILPKKGKKVVMITEQESVYVYQISRKKSEKVVISGSMKPLAELPNDVLNKLDDHIYEYVSSR